MHRGDDNQTLVQFAFGIADTIFVHVTAKDITRARGLQREKILVDSSIKVTNLKGKITTLHYLVRDIKLSKSGQDELDIETSVRQLYDSVGAVQNRLELKFNFLPSRVTDREKYRDALKQLRADIKSSTEVRHQPL